MRFKNPREEMQYTFEEANTVIGIKMEYNKVRKYVLCDDKREDNKTLIFAHRFDEARQEAIKGKIKQFMWINTQQVDMFEY